MKPILTKEQAHAKFLLRRRRRMLRSRIQVGYGSENSLRFDRNEIEAIDSILKLVNKFTKEKRVDDGNDIRVLESTQKMFFPERSED